MKNFFQLRVLDFFSLRQAARPRGLPSGFTFRTLSQGDFERCPMALEKNRHGKFVGRIENGHSCYGIQEDASGRIIAYFWVSSEGSLPPLLMDSRIKLEPGQHYVWDCRVDPLFQKQGFYTCGLELLRVFCPQGSLWINCESHNMPSRKGIQTAGFTFEARVYFLKVGAFVLFFQNILPNRLSKLYSLPPGAGDKLHKGL